MNFNNLTKGERFVVDWQYDLGGSFAKYLAFAISKADTTNREKLRKGFPEEVQAMYDYQNTAGWWENVESKLKDRK